MSAAEWTNVLTAVAAILNALLWPLIVLVIVLRFAPQLAGLVGSGRDVRIKAPGGFEASFTAAVEAAAALGAAEAKRAVAQVGTESTSGSRADMPAAGPGAGADMPSPASMARTVTSGLRDARVQQDLHGATVLWVDDRPDNNRWEREALQALGVRFELSTTTEDALRLLARRSFDAVISDLSRGLDRRAGLDLLDAIRRSDPTTPFFIYGGAQAVRSREEILAHGAQGCTSSPQELMAMVIAAIRDRHGR